MYPFYVMDNSYWKHTAQVNFQINTCVELINKLNSYTLLASLVCGWTTPAFVFTF